MVEYIKCRNGNDKKIDFPNKKYQIIYADPPWSFKMWSDKGWDKREQHYNRMSFNDIYDLPIKNISCDNSVLFLWVTMPLLPEGLKNNRKMGFKYKTVAFTWVKRNKISDKWFLGMGYYTRANVELCLLATMGKILKRMNRNVLQIVDERIMKHSKKPDIVRNRIIDLFGELPRIELFAREKTNGWDTWGNEV